LQDVKTSPDAVAGRKAKGGRGRKEGGGEKGRERKEGGRKEEEERKRDREREGEKWKVRIRLGWRYECLDMTVTVKQFTSETYDFRFDQIPICKGKSM
jgi:hypothetical protein